MSLAPYKGDSILIGNYAQTFLAESGWRIICTLCLHPHPVTVTPVQSVGIRSHSIFDRYGCPSKNMGVSPQIIHLFIGFSIMFTIHFGVVPLFLETSIYTWQFCDRDLFGMVSENVIFSKVVGDLQLGDKKVTLNHLVYIYIYIWCSVAHPPPPCGWVMVPPPCGCGAVVGLCLFLMLLTFFGF